MSDLTIQNLTKSFGGTIALDNISMHAEDGELLTLLGPSGCGKSTTLWSIAGLHQPDSGAITVGDQTFYDGRSTNIRPEERDCGVVFQSYAIWPHMSVRDNVGYPLKLRRINKKSCRSRVDEVLELVEMGEFAERYPHELSGGQQQRVALARALAFPPNLLLLDEPFSNLDAKLRDRAREWLKALQRSVGVTTVFVTHDQEEALSMSDRIVVMSRGEVRQVGTPEQIYNEPADRFVADFIGTTNLVDGRLVGSNSATFEVELREAPIRIVSSQTAPSHQAVTLSMRPEALRVSDVLRKPTEMNEFRVRVTGEAFFGDHYKYWLDFAGENLVAQSQTKLSTSEAMLQISPEAVRALPEDPIDKLKNDEVINASTK